MCAAPRLDARVLGSCAVCVLLTLPRPAAAEQGPNVDPMDVLLQAARGPAVLWLQVQINGALVGTELLLSEAGEVWVEPALLEQWRLRVPAARARDDRVPLSALAGVAVHLDADRQQLRIEAAPEAFVTTQWRAASTAPVVQPAGRGSFLNYDVSLSHADAGWQHAGWFEWGLFGPSGYATTTWLLGDQLADAADLVRLDSTWSHQDPQSLRTLRLGDGITRAQGLGRARRFGGLSWGSDFSLRPDLVAFPLPTISATTAVPSTVDVYVDQVLRLRREVPAGPFEFSDLPVTTGLGQTQLVVRDALGRSQSIPFEFYTSSSLLRPGLRSWNYDVGFTRQNYGLASHDYGEFLVSAQERYGFSNSFTGEWSADWTRAQTRMALGGVWSLPSLGTVSASMAGSRADAGSGGLLSLGLERRGSALSFGMNGQWATRNYDAGTALAERLPRQRVSAGMAWSLGTGGSLALNALQQRAADDTRLRIASLGYTRNLGDWGFMNLSLSRQLQPEPDWQLALLFTLPLGPDQVLSSTFNQTDDGLRARVDLQRNAPAGRGWGYRAAFETGAGQRLDAGAVYQGDSGILRAELLRQSDQTQLRLQASGSVVWLDGALRLGRPLYQSFAMVDAGGVPGVRVYAENQWVATTGADGQALVPDLRPWQRNALRLEALDLPLDLRVDSLALEVVPPARSGVALHFAVAPQRAVQLHLVLADGVAIPAGSEVRLWPGGRSLPLGLDGLVYADQLAASDNRLELVWHGQRCAVPLELPPADPSDPVPDLGVHTCTGVGR